MLRKRSEVKGKGRGGKKRNRVNERRKWKMTRGAEEEKSSKRRTKAKRTKEKGVEN